MRVILGETEESVQRHTKEGHVTTEGKIAGMSDKPEIATDGEQPPEAGKRQQRILP